MDTHTHLQVGSTWVKGGREMNGGEGGEREKEKGERITLLQGSLVKRDMVSKGLPV